MPSPTTSAAVAMPSATTATAPKSGHGGTASSGVTAINAKKTYAPSASTRPSGAVLSASRRLAHVVPVSTRSAKPPMTPSAGRRTAAVSAVDHQTAITTQASTTAAAEKSGTPTSGAVAKMPATRTKSSTPSPRSATCATGPAARKKRRPRLVSSMKALASTGCSRFLRRAVTTGTPM